MHACLQPVSGIGVEWNVNAKVLFTIPPDHSPPPCLPQSIMRDGDYVDVVEAGSRVLFAAGVSDPAFAASSATGQFVVGGDTTPLSQC
jgi:hypothetical protein